MTIRTSSKQRKIMTSQCKNYQYGSESQVSKESVVNGGGMGKGMGVLPMMAYRRRIRHILSL